MAKPTVSHTALGSGVCRFIEQYQPDGIRLFDDPLIGDLVGTPLKLMMQFSGLRQFTFQQTEAVADGIYGAQVCRTRYIDKVVVAALSQGIRQLVILGAGLDTRAYRLPGIEQAAVFELDLPAGQKKKISGLKKHLGSLPGNVSYLPIDFETQSLAEVLTAGGFKASIPSMFVWEAVTQYITEGAARKTLDFVGKCASGSLLVFTYILISIIERRQENYLQPVRRKLVVSEGERIALARVG